MRDEYVKTHGRNAWVVILDIPKDEVSTYGRDWGWTFADSDNITKL